MNIEQWIWSKMKIPPKMVEFKNITYEYGQRWIERMPSIQFLSISSATYWQVSLAVTRIRSHIFDFYFVLQTAASDISNQHEMSHHNLVMMMQDLNSPKGFTPVWCPLFVQLIWKSASFAKLGRPDKKSVGWFDQVITLIKFSTRNGSILKEVYNGEIF